ncbi:hypothetical protein Ahy_A03g014855 [Arachis hypogaea]|uniref:UBA domain-containing protein n=1 Tax=Arachis hypogaea TaxID=3818 RepID=A0A445DYX1_ARAHY|nr:hypothetical protein Ahy_A03g014855 [Arachis hypogaea]
MARLKIRGTWSGVLEDVTVDAWTVPKLREEVAMRANCSPDCINLTFAGMLLKDDDADAGDVRNLASLGVKINSKIFASRISPQESDAFRREEEFFSRLEEIREAEDQSGQLVHISSEMEHRAVMMGVRLHAIAVRLIGCDLYNSAVEVLSLGEEAFSICDPNLIKLIYIVPILHINMVWCYFMKGDIRLLSDAGKRLEIARTGIERDQVKKSVCRRQLEKLHLRLDLLEGVVAYHSGQIEKSRKALLSAKVKFIQHQGPVDPIMLFMSFDDASFGFTLNEANRALKMCNGDVGVAIDFLIEEEIKEMQKCNDHSQRRKKIWFGEELAAEALKRNKNYKLNALDDLKNPETISTLQADIESMKRERQKQGTDFAIEKAVQMGFERSRVVAAFEAGGTSEEVIQRLKVQPEGPSDISKAEEQNEEIKGELSADIEIANEGPVIIFYLRLVELALRRLWEEDVPSQHDEKEGYKFM